MKFTLKENPQVHLQPHPQKTGVITVGIVFPEIEVRFDVTPQEGAELVKKMTIAATKVIELVNEQEKEIVTP